jgi:hypothetical protein
VEAEAEVGRHWRHAALTALPLSPPPCVITTAAAAAHTPEATALGLTR